MAQARHSLNMRSRHGVGLLDQGIHAEGVHYQQDCSVEGGMAEHRGARSASGIDDSQII